MGNRHLAPIPGSDRSDRNGRCERAESEPVPVLPRRALPAPLAEIFTWPVGQCQMPYMRLPCRGGGPPSNRRARACFFSDHRCSIRHNNGPCLHGGRSCSMLGIHVRALCGLGSADAGSIGQPVHGGGRKGKDRGRQAQKQRCCRPPT